MSMPTLEGDTALRRFLGRSGLSRREFMAYAAGSGLSMVVAETVWNASAAAQQPKKGGSVRFGVTGGSSEDTLDPSYAPDTAIGLVWLGIRNCLTEVKENGELVGELAQSWEPSADAKSWTFKLRPGVAFHSGKQLTAEDV